MTLANRIPVNFIFLKVRHVLYIYPNIVRETPRVYLQRFSEVDADSAAKFA